tara:strand:- start:1701 stop:2099 length:399 start_codon:yes stop_codon:yes gene_type:complete
VTKKFLKKIIAQNQDDLRIISALCTGALVNKSEIKFLKQNKVFLIPLERKNKEIDNSNEKIFSILKFEFIEQSKSKNINLEKKELFLELIAIDTFKKKENFEIVILFLNNTAITLTSEVIEVTLEDMTEIND